MAEEMFGVEDVWRVGDPELIARLRRLVRVDQALSARLLVHLGEVDARRLYREHAYPSMFAYCVEELRISEAQAYSRIQAARLGRQFPRVLQLLARGEVNLTTIKLLGPHLTAENHVRLLDRARGKRKRGIELLVAEIAPKPDVPSRMRRLPDSSARLSAPSNALLSPTSAATPATCALEATVSPSRDAQHVARLASNLTAAVDGSNAATADCVANAVVACSASNAASTQTATNAVRSAGGSNGSVSRDARDAQNSGPHAAFVLEVPRARSSSKPLSPGRYKVEFTAGQALHDKLEQLQDLLRHQVPDGDLAAIVERAVDLLIVDTMKKRFAQTPRASKQVRSPKTRSANSRYVPRAVVREVHQRDGGQCTFVSADGKRCSERAFLELHHHDRPYARGGEATVENLRLVCRAHNALFADRDYGRTFMRAKQDQRRESRNELVLGASSDVTSSPPTPLVYGDAKAAQASPGVVARNDHYVF